MYVSKISNVYKPKKMFSTDRDTFDQTSAFGVTFTEDSYIRTSKSLYKLSVWDVKNEIKKNYHIFTNDEKVFLPRFTLKKYVQFTQYQNNQRCLKIMVESYFQIN